MCFDSELAPYYLYYKYLDAFTKLHKKYSQFIIVLLSDEMTLRPDLVI